MKSRVHVIISGRVQGVWFRANTRDKAEQLGINGWVRNTHDGNVEAVFEGDEEHIKEMINWCRQGPPMAKVENLIIEKQPVSDEFNGFSIKYY